MGLARQISATRLTPSAFDDFVAQRPDDETWELIDGQVVMQAQPTFAHQVIGGNIERLLNDALSTTRPELIALQGPTIDLEGAATLAAAFVPDVGVLDASAVDAGLGKSAGCHLAVEVISPSDRKPVSDGSRRARIDVKVEGYKGLTSCEAIVLVEQDDPLVVLHVREGLHWAEVELRSLDDIIALPRFGLRCTVAAFYARTPVVRPGAPRTPTG